MALADDPKLATESYMIPSAIPEFSFTFATSIWQASRALPGTRFFFTSTVPLTHPKRRSICHSAVDR
jgi:hypothetical protein